MEWHISEGTPPIVVGVDGSSQSCQALRWAAQMARHFGAPIRVVTAWQQYASSAYGNFPAPPEWDAEEEMRQSQAETIAGVFGRSDPDGVTAVLEGGGAAHVLLDASAGALMLVVGSRGHGGFAGLLLGSVSGTVAEHASCPVLVVHGDRPPPLPNARA